MPGDASDREDRPTPRDSTGRPPIEQQYAPGLIGFAPNIKGPTTGPNANPPPWPAVTATEPQSAALRAAPTVPTQRGGGQVEEPPVQAAGPDPASDHGGTGTTVPREPVPAGHRRPPPRHHGLRRYAALGGAAIGIAAVVIVGVANEKNLLGQSARPTGAPRSPPLLEARDWLLADLDPNAVVMVPATLAADLATHGRASDRIVPYQSAAEITYPSPAPTAGPDYHCCAFLVVAAPSPAYLGVGLPTGAADAYTRSRALARFTDPNSPGGQTVEVRQIVDDTPAELATAVQADRAEAADAGIQIAAAHHVDLGPVQRVALTSGAVDSRLLLALVGMTGRHSISISAFPQAASEAAAGAVARTMVISAIDAAPIRPGSPAVQDLTTFLAAQLDAYRPAHVEVGNVEGGVALTVEYSAPSPLGLLGPQG